MKKTLFTLAIVLFAMAAQAQTALKVHSNGVLSIQSASTTKTCNAGEDTTQSQMRVSW